MTLQLQQQFLPFSQERRASGYGIHHLSQLLFRQQCCQAQTIVNPRSWGVSCLRHLPFISIYLVDSVSVLQAFIPVSSLAPSSPGSSQAGDTCRFANATFPFSFPSYLESESWVLFPALLLTKPLGELLTLVPCWAVAKRSIQERANAESPATPSHPASS